MSQYVFLKQSSGEYLKLLADDDGIIQYTTNLEDYNDILATAVGATVTTDATLNGDGSSGDPLGLSAVTVAKFPVDVRTTLVAPGSTVLVSGLDGANDGDYECYFQLPINATSGEIKFQINSSDANVYAAWTEITGATTVQGARTTDRIQLSPGEGIGNTPCGWIRMRSAVTDSPTDPEALGTIDMFQSTGPVMRHTTFVYGSATNITSLKIVAANANAHM